MPGARAQRAACNAPHAAPYPRHDGPLREARRAADVFITHRPLANIVRAMPPPEPERGVLLPRLLPRRAAPARFLHRLSSPAPSPARPKRGFPEEGCNALGTGKGAIHRSRNGAATRSRPVGASDDADTEHGRPMPRQAAAGLPHPDRSSENASGANESAARARGMRKQPPAPNRQGRISTPSGPCTPAPRSAGRHRKEPMFTPSRCASALRPIGRLPPYRRRPGLALPERTLPSVQSAGDQRGVTAISAGSGPSPRTFCPDRRQRQRAFTPDAQAACGSCGQPPPRCS